MEKVLLVELKFVFPALLFAMAMILLIAVWKFDWELLYGVFAGCLLGLSGVAMLVAINGTVHSRLHVRTHATLCLLLVIGAGITIGVLHLNLASSALPFILFAFLLGILGSTLGVYDRVNGRSALPGGANYEAELQHMTKTNVDCLHSQVVQQVYVSIFIGGLFGVIGLVVATIIPGVDMVPFSKQQGITLQDWLLMRPNNLQSYSLLVLLCLLFGYSERLVKSILSNLENVLESLIPAEIEKLRDSDSTGATGKKNSD